jgi:MFS family permease
MKKWMPLFVLSLAAFMLALDSATLSVSIAQLVTEFNTTVVGIQRVVTYTSLIMASLMLVGGKLGDIFGRRRVFAIG